MNFKEWVELDEAGLLHKTLLGLGLSMGVAGGMAGDPVAAVADEGLRKPVKIVVENTWKDKSDTPKLLLKLQASIKEKIQKTPSLKNAKIDMIVDESGIILYQRGAWTRPATIRPIILRAEDGVIVSEITISFINK